MHKPHLVKKKKFFTFILCTFQFVREQVYTENQDKESEDDLLQSIGGQNDSVIYDLPPTRQMIKKKN